MQSTQVLLILAGVLALVFWAIALLLRALVSRNQRVVESRLFPDRDATTINLALPRREPQPRGATGAIDRWFSRLVAESGIQLAPETAFLLLVLVGAIVGGVLYLWRDNVPLGGLGMLLGMLLVLGTLYGLRARWRRTALEQLPDAISVLARAVRAGQTLDQALELVGDQIAKPLGPEFHRSARHLGVGLSINIVMQALAHRVPLGEVQILASTLAVQRRSGGNLPETLESIATVIRDRLSYRRQLRAATAGSRMSVFVIFLAGPVVVAWMYRLQPAYMYRFIEHPQGKYLLGTAIALQVVGLLWVFRLLRPDY